MGIPNRFASEYASRCLNLINALEGHAFEEDLVGSFSLLAAASVLTIPFERMQSKHFLHREQEKEVYAALRGLSKIPFVDAPFWLGESPKGWMQSRIKTDVNDPRNWLDQNDCHPLAENAINQIGNKKTTEVLRVLRNSLAHGNIIYLNKHGDELVGDQVYYLAFLSRYEEGLADRKKAETYRVITVSQREFLRFVKLWAQWVAHLGQGDRIFEDDTPRAQPAAVI
jgi:hypothetical protein